VSNVAGHSHGGSSPPLGHALTYMLTAPQAGEPVLRLIAACLTMGARQSVMASSSYRRLLKSEWSSCTTGTG
jgi:hypothetical protein